MCMCIYVYTHMYVYVCTYIYIYICNVYIYTGRSVPQGPLHARGDYYVIIYMYICTHDMCNATTNVIIYVIIYV